MRNEIYKFEGFKYTRVSLTIAKKLFNEGRPVGLLAYNLRPGPWVQISHVTNYGGATFENLINSYSYYNCLNAETGKTVKYFKIEKIS